MDTVDQRPLDGNAMQHRIALEQVAEAAVVKFAMDNPDLFKRTADIPAPLKWAGTIVGGLFTMGVGALVLWMVTSIASVQITLARVEERIASMDSRQGQRLDQVESRLAALESKERKE